MFSYEIGGKKYTQQKLVLGQVQQLIALLKSAQIPARLTAWSVIETLGDKLSEGIAIVLREDGKPLKEKDLPELTKEIQFSIDPETSFEVVEDFFDRNPINLTLERLTGSITRISGKIGLNRSSSSSPVATSQSEPKSSGDSPSSNARVLSDLE
jgi:hypothetical protein